MKKSFTLLLAIVCLLCLLPACNGSGETEQRFGDTIPLKYAKFLTMVDCGDYVSAHFRNPWDTSKVLQTYLLVEKDKPLPASLPKGTIVRTPLENSLVYTSVHSNLIHQLGALDAIRGVCDAQYIYNPVLKARIDNGTVADCGNSMMPNIEKILMLYPDAILLSAYENSNDHNKVAQVGVPIIDCIDYMETSPLARAEWMKFFGLLYGREAEADTMFTEAELAYQMLKSKVEEIGETPKVLTDMIYGQSWSVPGAYSTTGLFIEDAGGYNPFDEYKKSGSVQLAPEEVLYKNQDADIWIIRYGQKEPLTLKQLKIDNPIYSKFKAYQNGMVFGCNTSGSPYFEEAAFHPHWVLAEWIEMLHPGTLEDNPYPHYFTKIE